MAYSTPKNLAKYIIECAKGEKNVVDSEIINYWNNINNELKNTTDEETIKFLDKLEKNRSASLADFLVKGVRGKPADLSAVPSQPRTNCSCGTASGCCCGIQNC